MTHLIIAFVRCTIHGSLTCSTSDVKTLKATNFTKCSTIPLVYKCTVVFNNLSYWFQKCTGIIFKEPIFHRDPPHSPCRRGSSSPAPYHTRLPLSQWDSAPASLQLPTATFLFQFENPFLSTLLVAGSNILIQKPNKTTILTT